MRFFVFFPLLFLLIALAACDAKKSEPPVAEQAPAKPLVEISGSLDFPEIPVGASASKTLTVKNPGAAPLVVSATYPEALAGADAHFTIEPGAERAIVVIFSPTKPGAFQGVATFTTNAGNQEIPASGFTKELTGILELSSETPFGKVRAGEKAIGSLLLRNIGNAPLEVAAITLPEGFQGNFNGSIDAGTERRVPVVFFPEDAKTYAGQVTVNLTAGRGATFIEISGTGTPLPPAPPGMTTIPAGRLPADSPLDDEQVQAFHIGTHETTWGEWNAVSEFARLNNYDLPPARRSANPTHPVRNVSWHDAVKWLNARSQMEGLRPVYSVNGEVYRRGIAEPVAEPAADGYRLPTEAEWEWAARGASKSRGTRFSGGNDLNDVAWNWDNTVGTGEDLLDGRGPAPVGLKKPNELGIHDMSGNIAEWCWTPALTGARQIRGGAWLGSTVDCEIANRSFAGASEKHDYLGFRYARNLVDPTELADQKTAELALGFATAETLPDATANTPYSAKIELQGGKAPYALTLKTGSTLPPGLVFSEGTIRGTPKTAGTFQIALSATDSAQPVKNSAASVFTLRVAPYGLSIGSEPTLINAKYNQPLSVTFTPTGGAEPYRWSLLGNLPRGLRLDPRSGELSGNPLTPGVTSLTIRLRDSKGFEALRVVPLSVAVEPLEISPEPAEAPTAVAGMMFVWNIGIAGGIPPYRLQPAPDSNLPEGLSAWVTGATGKLAGKPAAPGAYSITLEASDSRGEKTTRQVSLTVAPYDLAISPESIGSLTGKFKDALEWPLTATGGKPPYYWSVSGSLPSGLWIAGSSGKLAGTPYAVGEFPITLKVTDANRLSATANATVVINADPLQIVADPIENSQATTGLAFRRLFTIRGGVQPYTLKLADGSSLPPGLSLEFTGTKGEISGKPTEFGNFSFALAASDSRGESAEISFEVPVSAYDLQISEALSLPVAAKFDEQLAVTLAARGGREPYRWTIEGKLPRGVVLNARAGTLTGKPQGDGEFPVVFKVTDANRLSATRNGSIVVAAKELKIETLQLTSTPTPEPTPTSPQEAGPASTLEAILIDPAKPQPTPQPEPSTSPKTEARSASSDGILVKGGELPAISPLGKQPVGQFLIDRTETTWGNWKEIRSQSETRGYDIASVGEATGDNHPVRNVSWFDALKWCNLRSEIEGLQPVYVLDSGVFKTGETTPHLAPGANGYRLPTEVEWEWAARGGASSKGTTYSGSNDPDSVAWYASDSESSEPRPVGGKTPNELGLHDMSGNVREWVWDAHKAYRRVRGGSAGDQSFECTVSVSDFNYPNRRTPDTGFRTVRNPSN